MFEVYWGRVRGILLRDLEAQDWRESWRIHLDEDIDAPGSGMGVSGRKPEAFGVLAQNLTGRSPGCLFRISRGKSVCALADRDYDVVKALWQEGYKSDDWWVGYRFFSAEGLLHFSIKDGGEVFRINQDNHTNGPMAKRAAALMWSLFLRHREDLEELNRSYPY